MATASFSYYPTEEQLSRFKGVDTTGDAGPKVPEGFPTVLRTPLAWTAEELKKDLDSCIVKLSEEDIKALEASARAFEGKWALTQFGF